MKPLDFIRTKQGNVGMIVEVSTNGPEFKAAVEFIGRPKEKFAWWYKNEFEIIDSLPDLLSRNLKHPFGVGSLQPFALKNRKEENGWN